MTDKLVPYTPPETALGRPTSPDTNPVAVFLARLSSGSLRTMDHALRTILAVLKAGTSATIYNFPWWKLRYQHTAAIRARLRETYTPATCNKMLSALRGVLKECRRLGLMSADDCANASDIDTVQGERVLKGRAVTMDEFKKMVALCDRRTARGARDAAVLHIMYYGGLRREEVTQLRIGSYIKADGEPRIKVLGKRNKERIVYLTPTTVECLERWLTFRKAPDETSFLFISLRKDAEGAQSEKKLSTQSIWNFLDALRERADVPKFSPHDMRRSYITRLLEKGVDLATVQQLAGHANIATTTRYDRRGEKAKMDAVRKLEE